MLVQDKREACKKLLKEKLGSVCISDFSLHSIGIILFRNDKENIFAKFASDVLPRVDMLALSKEAYIDLPEIRSNSGLDFDDAYQYKLAKENGLEILTMDTDFRKVKQDIKVTLL